MAEQRKEPTPEERAAYEQGFAEGARCTLEQIAAAANSIAVRWNEIKSPVAKTVACALEALRDALLEGPPPAVPAEDDTEQARGRA